MDLSELYQNVYENPGDDRRRLVLADALLEQGDVRGELISLQFATHAVARKRAKKLIERHRAHFLGPLNDVVLHGSDTWERGFLVGCIARLSGSTVDCPAWATVRHLGVMSGGALEPSELSSRWMRSLKSLELHSDREGYWVRQHELRLLRGRVVKLVRDASLKRQVLEIGGGGLGPGGGDLANRRLVEGE